MSWPKRRVGTTSDKRQGYRLMHRHSQQIAGRPEGLHADLCGMVALTFEPGDGTSSFIGKTRRPLGSAVLTALTYVSKDRGAGRIKRSMPFQGLSAEPAGGRSVRFGAGGRKFLYDGMGRLSRGARGPALDPQRDAARAELLLLMDRTCERRVSKPSALSTVPRLPKILLGFEPSESPTFEDSRELRQLAAKQLGVSVNRLGINGSELLDQLLRDVWEQAIISADAPDNSTGHTLISAELCSQFHQARRIYEDFADLMGLAVWNPSREVRPRVLFNPAKDVLSRYYPSQDFDQPMSNELVEQLEWAMRDALGPVGSVLSQDEIYDGLVSPEQPLTAWTEALPQLRARLAPFFSSCTSDNDLLLAARNPAEPLIASGGCRVQALQVRRDVSSSPLVFSPGDLHRHITLDLRVDDEPALWSNGRVTCEPALVGAQ